MNIQNMTLEISRTSDELSQDSRLFFEDVARHIRGSSLNERKGEEVLLYTVRRMQQLESKGRNLEDEFGDDPQAYAEELISDLYMRRPLTQKDKLRYYVMIAWVALTWVFFIYMVIGFLGKGTDGGFAQLHINTTTLVLIALGAIVLMELVTRFAGNQEDTADKPSKPRALKTEVRTLVITLIAAIIVIGIYAALGHSLPTLQISPWTCLIVFVIGFIGQFILMPRKPQQKQ